MCAFMITILWTADTNAERKKKNCSKEKVCFFLAHNFFYSHPARKKGFPSVVVLLALSGVICMLTVVVQQYHQLKCESLLAQKSKEKNNAENKNYVSVSVHCATKKKKAEPRQEKKKNFKKLRKTWKKIMLNYKEVVSGVMPSLAGFVVTELTGCVISAWQRELNWKLVNDPIFRLSQSFWTW